MMKKILVMILAVVLCFGSLTSMAYAEDAIDTTDTEIAAAEEVITAEEEETSEADAADEMEEETFAAGDPFTVGVILKEEDSTLSRTVMGGLNAIGEPLGVTFQPGYCGPNWEEELAVVQNFAVGGFDGIVLLHSGANLPQMVSICEEYGMYLVTSNEPAHWNEEYYDFSENPYFAGEVWEDEQVIVESVLEHMIANGAKQFGLCTLPDGQSSQVDWRFTLAYAILYDLGFTDDTIHSGRDTDLKAAAENLLAQYPQLDAIFLGGATDPSIYEALNPSGSTKKILLNCYEPGDEEIAAMKDGTLSFAAAGNCAEPMIAFILLYNAMSGHKMLQDDMTAASINMQSVLCTSAEELEQMLAYCSESNPPYAFEELQSFLGEEASYNDLKAFAEQFSLEDLLRRHEEKITEDPLQEDTEEYHIF